MLSICFSSDGSHKAVNPNMFTHFELNNFLTDTLAAGYSLSAMQIFRAAVCLLHKDPEHVRNSTNLKALLKHSKRAAPPKQLLKPTVDITLGYASWLKSHRTTLPPLLI
jgi:hypothetical protein